MASATEALVGGIFEVEEQDDTLIVTPVADLRETAYQLIETGARAIFKMLSGTPDKNVVLDFHKTDYFGSSALGFFLRLGKRARGCNGRMAFCNVSNHEREVLRFTRLDQLWPICSSRSEALAAVRDRPDCHEAAIAGEKRTQ